jgi:hypothetical protein
LVLVDEFRVELVGEYLSDERVGMKQHDLVVQTRDQKLVLLPALVERVTLA